MKMKKIVTVLVALALLCAVLMPALADGAIKRIGTLQMLNMTEEEYAAFQEQRAAACRMLNEVGIPAENPYYDGMIDPEPQIVFYDNLNEMVMALESDQIDAIDLNRSTAEYLCANHDGLDILMDYDECDSVLTDFLFNSMLGFDYSLMLTEANAALAEELDDAVTQLLEEGMLDELAEKYIDAAVDGEVPAVELPVFEGADTVRVAVTGDLPPMDFVSPDGQPAGFNVAVLAELSRRIEKNIELVTVSAGARAVALASGQVDAVFWCRSCTGATEMVTQNAQLSDFFTLEDEEDEEMLDRIESELMPIFDYVRYADKDMPEGVVITDCYYADSIVLVVKQ